MEFLETFLAPDRRAALARHETLPDRATGAVLFADVSGFTHLTEAMTLALGARRGAEELTRQLNRVYDALIAQIENYGGSVITFSGDAALCFFANEGGQSDAPSLNAAACAMALQRAMQEFKTVALPGGTTTALAIKVTVATGSVRRFVVGDPNIRQVDVSAGSTVARTATAEHLAHPGEILVDVATAEALGERAGIAEWRTDASTGERFAVVQSLAANIAPAPPPPSPPLSDELLKPWLHAAVYERARANERGSRAEEDAFLTELRPVVALFARFRGIAFDADEAAGEKLDRFIARVQQILARYDGTLLELTIGDKGSYFYATFGALRTHEDDARRAVLAARELFPLCGELGFIEPLQIGISQGVMRVGAYGGVTRRMYGAQGDDVNLAARLMLEAAPGTVLVSGSIQKVIGNEFDLEPLPPIRLKGKEEPLLPFRVQGLRQTRIQQLQEAYYALPMIGREQEFARVQERLERARRGQGQVVGITADAGMGKSRLTAEIIRTVRRQRESSYGGECQSFGTNISYLVWTPIWRAFFGLDPNLPLRRQIRVLESQVEQLVPERAAAVPLLGAVLNLPIPENDFTRALEPEFRKSALHALLLDCVQAAAKEARAEGQALLFVIEDAHWIDPASRELLQELASKLDAWSVLILLNYRPPEDKTEHWHFLETLPNFVEIVLAELTDAQGEGLIRAKLALHAPESTGTIPPELVARVNAHAQGNPFYIEQLLDYLHDRGTNFRDPAAFAEQTQDFASLPPTLHRLILSRIDQLNEQQQLTLKAASIIGRWFSVAHLCGYFPRLGSVEQVRAQLALLQNYDLTVLDQTEPELAYLFKHMVTHQVAYEALAYATRAMLHEEYARFLETHQDPLRVLDVIAYHYDRSQNMPKRREYLRRAGEAAAARFANVEALDYLTRALALAPESDAGSRYELLCARERIFDVRGERDQQASDLAELEKIAHTLAEPEKELDALTKRAWLAERMTNHAAATDLAKRIAHLLASAEIAPAARAETETEAALLEGVILWQQGNAAHAKPHFERALAIARTTENRVAQARALSFLGTVYRELGEYARAEAHFQEQLTLAHAQGDRRREWAALNNLGLIANARDHYEVATRTFMDALQIVREIGDRLGEAMVFYNLAIAALNLGEYERTEVYSQQAFAIASAIGARRDICNVVLILGEVHRLLGDYGPAETETERALKLARELGDRLNENFALMNLAAIALAKGELERARRLIEEALPLARAIGHREGESFLLNTSGQVQLAQGEIGEAQETFEHALTVLETLEPLVQALDTYAGLAEIALRRNDLESACAYAEIILAYLEAHPAQRGAPVALAACLTAYRVLVRAKDARVREVLVSAREALEGRAEKIGDGTRRRSFLENVRAHRELSLAAGNLM